MTVLIMAYSQLELDQKLSENLSTLEQLRYFERIIGTRHRVAEANTYDSREYKEIVLEAYQEYLDAVKDNIKLREDFEQALQRALKEK
jgi:hypothetical protein